VERAKELLASAGVVLLLTPEFKGIRLSGAAYWIAADKAVIQLSMRYKTNDHFWFTLFHESGHLLERARGGYVDAEGTSDNADPEEQRADQFARDTLIPPGPYAAFRTMMDFTEHAVGDFARENGIAAGIVVGRLQRDGLIQMSRLNRMKQSFQWPVIS
jgi:Zn-dependent peptidase ImmA (M78 family)